MSLIQQQINELKDQASLVIEKLSRLRKARILEDDPTRQLRYEEQIKEGEQELQQIKAEIDKLKNATTPKSTAEGYLASGPPLHDYHKFTCDRVEQCDVFQNLFDKNKIKKTHYFYIYGAEVHSHFGLFNRFAFDLEGRLQDYLNPNLEFTCTAFRTEQITFDISQDLNIYKQNIIKSILAEFSINPNDQEPLLNKTLLDLLQSPRLQGLKETDFVCIFLSISEWDWNPDITPKVVTWLIESFCEVDIPITAPTFLFFFGIIYEDENSEIEEEVRRAIRAGTYIKELPELQLVQQNDIKRWFAKYKMLAPSSEQRRALYEQYFEDQPGFKMERIEIKFQKIIDNYNNRRLNK